MEFNSYEIIIVGGSYAGLSAGMALGRSLRRVLIIDSGKRCNRYAPYAHNFITQDGEPPEVIAAKARSQVSSYPTISIMDDLVTGGSKTPDGFEVDTASGETFLAQKLVFATGVMDLLPDIEGFEACWGKTLVHCPYCHGYELHGLKTGILANGERAYHLAQLVSNLTRDLTVMTQGPVNFDEKQKENLNHHNIRIVEDTIDKIVHDKGQITSIMFSDRSEEKFDAMYAAVPFQQHCDLPEKLGCTLTDQGHIEVDFFQKTNVEGVFACGDNCTPLRSIAQAVYSGNVAGASINAELTGESFAHEKA